MCVSLPDFINLKDIYTIFIISLSGNDQLKRFTQCLLGNLNLGIPLPHFISWVTLPKSEKMYTIFRNGNIYVAWDENIFLYFTALNFKLEK